jgi:tRNA (guanine-N7-)-methyltransferase
VTSSQTAAHPRLAALVARHAAGRFAKPVAPYSREAFETFHARWDGRQACVIDAGCGTGSGTARLAHRHADLLVVGVDQSAHRLARAPRDLPENAILLRADMVDIWSLCADAGVPVAAQYLLYPNPWPKPAQLARRWHAHPIFPTVLRLGGRIECRVNWRPYAEEFALAAGLLHGQACAVEEFAAAAPLTLFEHKYAVSGHALYRVVLRAPPGRPT